MSSYQNFIDSSYGLVYLSTAEDNTPSSRIVSFAVDENDSSIWYVFSINADTLKTRQVEKNNKVALITPVDLKTGMRMSSNRAKMVKSSKSWADVHQLFENNKGFMSAHKPATETLYEIHLSSLLLQTYNPADDQIINFK